MRYAGNININIFRPAEGDGPERMRVEVSAFGEMEMEEVLFALTNAIVQVARSDAQSQAQQQMMMQMMARGSGDGVVGEAEASGGASGGSPSEGEPTGERGQEPPEGDNP